MILGLWSPQGERRVSPEVPGQGLLDEAERRIAGFRGQELRWRERRSVCRHIRANRCPTKPRPVSETVSRGTGLRLLGDEPHAQLAERRRPRSGARPQGSLADSAIKSHCLEGTPSTTVCNVGFARGTRIRVARVNHRSAPTAKPWPRPPVAERQLRSRAPCPAHAPRPAPFLVRSAGWAFRRAVRLAGVSTSAAWPQPLSPPTAIPRDHCYASRLLC